MKSNGEQLPGNIREFFEPRFGRDFSDVRLHKDDNAHKQAGNINAKAFTIGNNIAFNTDRYSPSTSDGRKLLAHELTHVVQEDVLSEAISA